jgi:hypothetical protein
MLKRFYIVAALAVSLSCCQIGKPSGWQYAKWGMSVDQVVAASRGSAHRSSDKSSNNTKYEERATGTFDSGDMRFLVKFYFSPNNGGLNNVDVKLLNPDHWKELEAGLIAKYGTPYSDSAEGQPDLDGIRTRRWDAGDTQVTYFENYDDLSVDYVPQPDNKGL